MSDEQADDDQRRDKLLLKLLKTPAQSRTDLVEQVRRAKGKKAIPRRKKRRVGTAR